MYYGLNGVRAWNCNLEILNFGNIGGFICVRTFVEFAVLGLLVIYVIAPLMFRMACSISRNTFVTIWMIIGLVCVADIVYNDIICFLVPGLVNASEIYTGIGFKYMNY